MSKLNVDQKTIKDLLKDKSANFLIPDYQRPYAWGDDECQTLWDDIKSFAFPDDNKDAFKDEDDEYFLGSIVTFRNEKKQAEVIDGQQRLTTLLLLLRAFYDKFENVADEDSQHMRKNISQCIWQTDPFDNAIKEDLKIDSEVATDDEKKEFLRILKKGKKGIDSNTVNSKYAKNYRFFVEHISSFNDDEKYTGYLPYFAARILNNCILLPIEADSQDTALRIFSTLNDRGLPLADADIFKAQCYKYYDKKGIKDKFIDDWKDLSLKSEQIFNPTSGTPLDELFTKYMYYSRASEGNKSTTTEALRKFFEYEKYKRLLTDDTMENLKRLVDFWESIYNQDENRFTEEVLKKLFILKYAPNGMWEYIVSVYFLSFRDDDDNLEDKRFFKFLSKITAFIFAYALIHPGVNALRTPIYAEMLNLYKKENITFEDFKFNKEDIENALSNYKFTNNRMLTRSLITWYAFTFEAQDRPQTDAKFEIEHIYAKERHNKENKLLKQESLEVLGNKILLEKFINIRASDYRFEDKKRYYLGYTDAKGKYHPPSQIAEYKQLTQKDDFNENDILERDKQIHKKFMQYLADEGLIKD